MQYDANDAEHVVCYQSSQLQPAECNYPVHDKELLAMKYALAKFRVYVLGDRPFIVYTDHASFGTAVNSPHLLQRTERWLSRVNIHRDPSKSIVVIVKGGAHGRPK